MRVKKLFARHYREIRDALKEDLEGWGEIPSGPFNTDPLLEPWLKVLSKPPDCWFEDSETRDGIRSLFVVYICDATIRCKRYKDNGSDQPLSLEKFTGGVTYEIPVNFEVDLESGCGFGPSRLSKAVCPSPSFPKPIRSIVLPSTAGEYGTNRRKEHKAYGVHPAVVVLASSNDSLPNRGVILLSNPLPPSVSRPICGPPSDSTR